MHHILPVVGHMLQEQRFYQTVIQFLNSVLLHDTGKTRKGSNLDSDIVGLVPATLNLILVVAELGTTHKNELVSNGVLASMSAIFNDKSFDSQIHATALLICASVCQDSKANRTVFCQENGVNHVIQYLK